MGIVKINELMHSNLRIASNAMSRSINAQAEHWMKVGMLAEMYPQLTYPQLARELVRIELENGEAAISMLVSQHSPLSTTTESI